MALSIQDVEKIASLARLELTAEEKALYQEQLSAVLAYAERLNELDIRDVSPTSSAVPLKNVLREDEVQPSLALEDTLFNAPDTALDQFKIQAVFDGD
ncbi:MAG TPA: Asp-tRNA(Asn)/Glu-tRNA(Gln) amidotransferase subunit GatC [Anaerolineae bacterium]|jgi:aspartyl-tRNA(Asn)/glutamyl-tRNA(Gln) amidotransferase subunit C|nr:Asp-tRNA(Asn)/Glu-tRNA(Gln) amidotransferase subunit GatC [Anaerolineae bacterium]